LGLRTDAALPTGARPPTALLQLACSVQNPETVGMHYRIRNGLASLAVLVFGTPLFPATAAAEDSMRCGTRLVYQGDPKGKVLALCGEPTSVSVVGVARPPHYSYDPYYYSYFGPYWIEVPVEVWTYNFGSSRLVR
jgi:hypothetical protein